MQKVQIYDDASQNRLKHKTTALERIYLTARVVVFSLDFLRFFQFGGGTTTAPIGRRQTTRQKVQKGQKMRGI